MLPGGHCYERFKKEMDVFEKELTEGKIEIAEKWKQAEKQVIKMKWKTPQNFKHIGLYESEVKDGLLHRVSSPSKSLKLTEETYIKARG